ncbi:MAG: SCO1664 family protein [Propionibacteriaceae bacterium]|nr:SCO1664 family protein [Propionibacteriaceae bacterium]
MTGPSGALSLLGRLVDASNGTFLAADEQDRHWVYKPVAGEAPLWDFPTATLGHREVAAYHLSEELGLGLVPLTVWWEGPLGEGSVQRWVDGAPSELIDLLEPTAVDETWLPILTGLSGDDRPVVLAHRDDPRLRQLALFDAILNNSDRKASHVLSHDGALKGVDHGVSLHHHTKLRTVLWGWAGDPLTDDELALAARAAGIDAPLAPGLADEEWEAVTARAETLLAEGVMPQPSERWPSIPWPPM